MLNIPKLLRFLLTISAVAVAMLGLTPVAQAQGADEAIEEIITTGTRRAERTASQSSVPVDVVSGAEFENQGFPDMDDLLRNTLPSYNVQRIAIGDAATLIRPATLRGLPPDNNLVLVNGKRRHRASVISESGSLAAGAQGADLAAIPAMSIKQVEVLRDGASAQYGSDAIAGVLNFVLRDDADGFTVEARTGEFFEGDGTMLGLSANGGFQLGDDGFANITAQWREADPTSRSVQRNDAAGLIAFGAADQQANVRQPFAQIWGAPEIKNDWNVFLNSGIQLTDSQEVYLFGNVGERENIGGFFYRNPNDRGAVYHHSQGGDIDTDGDGIVDDEFENNYRAIVDQDDITPRIGGQISPCPALIAPPGTPTAADAAEVAADAVARAALTDSCWVMNKEVPGGYTPSFGGVMSDASAVLGLRGEFDNGMLYDFSGSIGRNETEFFLNNTWNPSRGPDAIGENGLQRDFDIGSYTETDVSLNADFVMPIAVDAFASDLNFAFGAEWRNEQFQVRVGEENSWQTGNFALQNIDAFNPNCYEDPAAPGTCDVIRDAKNVLGNGLNAPVIFDLDGDGMIGAGDGPKPVQLVNLSIGAHGFAGFSPPQAGRFDRANYAVYVDLEADVTERFTAGVAVRFEDFDDFGTTTNGKVSARLAITDRFAVRGSYSTGFRAPTPGQSNVTKVSTLIIDGELIQNGQIPPTNPIALALGSQPLKPEDATNFTVGAVLDLTDSISVTLDYYNIVLEDRIAQTGNIDITDEPALTDGSCPIAQAAMANLALCLQESGVPGAADLTSLRFFTNDFETTTQGIDFVATWALDWGGAGSGDLTAAWNWTETEVDRIGLEVSRNRVLDLENQNPQHRGIFTYNHFIGNLRLMGRASYYGDWIEADFGDDPTWWANIDPDGVPNPAYTEECAGVPDSSQFMGINFSDQCYPEQWIFDIEAGYSFNDTWTVIAGIQNVGDEFGPRNRNNGGLSSGDAYDEASPFGMDGGFWYFRVRADFE